MYTKVDALNVLGISRSTLYKHMEKNGINKGEKLTDEDIKVLINSIAKTKSVRVDVSAEKEYIYQINKLEKELLEKNEIIELLDLDNRSMMKTIQENQLLISKVQFDYLTVLNNNQKLLEESSKKKWWKK